MHLAPLDWIVITGCMAVCFLPALFFTKRSSRNTAEFFASGRAVPWWLAGVSMVATTFASDTPNLVTDIVRTNGVAGNWQWWAFVLSGMATVFFYARLWRRSRVLTDLEFYEIRYSGVAAEIVRGFRAIYLGFFFNCFIMATVNLAACKDASILFGIEPWKTLIFVCVINFVFAAQSGLWGVLVLDMIQFVIKMSAVIAAAYFALKQPQVGGLRGLVQKLSASSGPGHIHWLNILPDFHNSWDVLLTIFVVPLSVQWWASWYPGSEPGGGSYIAQRMLACRSEKDALAGVLFFNLAHYVLRPWPWILTGLASILVFPQLSDIQKAFPHMDPSLLGDDIAYPAMLKFLPVGFLGLMIGGLIVANSSTILTHLNWGASYLVHDFYQRFICPDRKEKHYVFMGRCSILFLALCASLLTYFLGTAQNAFHVIIQIGAGTGLLYLLRWFWWRINAWCEIVAMVSSFLISAVFLFLNRMGHAVADPWPLLITVAFTTICWLLTAWLGPQTPINTLIAFYKKILPSGPGWEPVRIAAGVSREQVRATGDKVPLSLLGWAAGCVVVWSGLFSLGAFFYSQMILTAVLGFVFAASGVVLIWVVNRLWCASELPN